MLISYWNNPIQSAGSNRINSFIQYLQEESWRIVLVTVNHDNRFLVNQQTLHFEKTLLPCDKRYKLDGLSPDVIFKQHFAHNPSHVPEVTSKIEAPSYKSKLISHVATKIQQTLLLPDGLYWGWYLPNRNKILSIYDKEKPDIVLTSAMPIACHFFGKRLALKRHATWVADFRDLYADNLLENGILSKHIKAKIQKKLVKPAHALTTVSHGLKRELIAQSNKAVSVIYNGYEKRTITPPAIKDKENIDTFGLYLGTLYASQHQAFSVFLNFIHQCKPDKPFYFIGNIERPDKLTTLIKHSNYSTDADQFIFKPYVPKETLHQYEEKSQYFLHFDFDIDGNLSSKIFHYLSSSKPLLFFTHNKNTELSEIVSTAGHKVISEHDCFHPSLTNYKATTPNMDFIKTFDRKNQALNMSRLLRKVVEADG